MQDGAPVARSYKPWGFSAPAPQSIPQVTQGIPGMDVARAEQQRAVERMRALFPLHQLQSGELPWIALPCMVVNAARFETGECVLTSRSLCFASADALVKFIVPLSGIVSIRPGAITQAAKTAGEAPIVRLLELKDVVPARVDGVQVFTADGRVHIFYGFAVPWTFVALLDCAWRAFAASSTVAPERGQADAAAVAQKEQLRQEQLRQEQARQEQLRLDQLRLEQIRQEQARLEQARLEQAQLEQARRERERAAEAERQRLAAEAARLQEEVQRRQREEAARLAAEAQRAAEAAEAQRLREAEIRRLEVQHCVDDLASSKDWGNIETFLQKRGLAELAGAFCQRGATHVWDVCTLDEADFVALHVADAAALKRAARDEMAWLAYVAAELARRHQRSEQHQRSLAHDTATRSQPQLIPYAGLGVQTPPVAATLATSGSIYPRLQMDSSGGVGPASPAPGRPPAPNMRATAPGVRSVALAASSPAPMRLSDGVSSPSAVQQQNHTFVLISSLKVRRCSVCERPCTGGKTSYQCSSCQVVSHKQCVPYVAVSCSVTVKSSVAPVAHALQSKHRGLRPLPSDAPRLLEGRLWKCSRQKHWKQYYFVLLDDDVERRLFYFGNKPSESGASSFPRGGILLLQAHINSKVAVDEHPFAICISSLHLDREILLAASSEDERVRWARALEAVVEKHASTSGGGLADWSKEPLVQLPVIADAVAEESFLEQMMTNTNRASLFTVTGCIDGDATQLPLQIRVEAVTQLSAERVSGKFFVSVHVFYAGAVIASESTEPASGPSGPAWRDSTLRLPKLSSLPPESILVLSVYELTRRKLIQKLMRNADDEPVIVGHCFLSLTNPAGQLRTGQHSLRLFPGQGSAMRFGVCTDDTAPLLRLAIVGAHVPVVYSSFPTQWLLRPLEFAKLPSVSFVQANVRKQVNPLSIIPPDERLAAWNNRSLSLSPDRIAYILQGCDFCVREQRREARTFLEAISASAAIDPSMALQLLGPDFASTYVRTYAMLTLTSQVAEQSLQLASFFLICTLFAQPADYSPMVDLLLRRVASQPALAHAFFWAAHGQTGPSQRLRLRFTSFARTLLLMLDADSAAQLTHDHYFASALCEVSRNDKRRVGLAALLEEYRKLPFTVALPTSMSHLVTGVNVEKSRVLASFAAPIFVRCPSANATPVPDIILKAGDDLRQDQICFLFGVIMNSVWTVTRLPCRLCIYPVVAIGDRCGIIEVVPDATSLTDVQGGGMEGAMSKKCLFDWLSKHRDKDISWERCISNFAASLAASCVFEYVLGLGDRHSGNLLIKRDGTLFHIDFGWILGYEVPNWGMFQPFTLTSAMVDLLGGPDGVPFQSFQDMALKAYMEIRRQHALLCGLLLLAVPAQLNHLSRVEDCHYLRDALAVDSTDEEAAKAFVALLNSSNKGLVQLNHGLHNLVVRKRGF